MQLPRLELHNTFALLGIQQRNATIEIRQPQAEIRYNLSQPEIKIEKTEGKFEIDQTEAFADANLKHPFRAVREWAERAKQKILQSFSEEANEGDRLMKIEGQTKSVIPEIAKQESEPPSKQISYGQTPSSANKVKISYQPSDIKIDINTKEIDFNAKTYSPKIQYHPGNFQIYLKQKAALHIQAIGAQLDQKI